MSSGFACLDIIGNVSKPTMRKAGEHDVLSFSVAANMQRMRNGAKEEYTLWVRVQIWNRFAVAMAPHLQQGVKVFCRGEPELHTYPGHDGIERTELRMSADVLKLIGDKRASAQHRETHADNYAPPPARQANNAPRQAQHVAQPAPPANDGYGDDDDSIPF
jgi:single stranded DNA-binding protein